MKLTKFFIFLSITAIVFAGCRDGRDYNDVNTNGYSQANRQTTSSSHDSHSTGGEHGASDKTHSEGGVLTEVSAPQRIKDMSATRGEQDAAAPTLTVVEPKNGSTVNSSIVKVKLSLGGDLKGYKPMKDPATGMGNHIHVILDNQPYEAYYNLEQEFELRNVADGEHTLRFFPSRPWHESYKNAGAFQIVRFTVKNGGADTTKPATTNSNQPMSNASPTTTPEGKDMANSAAGAVDAAKPLLTYSRPKGEYKAAEADPVMIDFWLSGGKLAGEGGEYRVRYTINGGEAKFIDKWQPLWLSGWGAGTHTVKLELVDRNGNPVDNGGYNSTSREITVVK